jgi:hypothetical protein
MGDHLAHRQLFFSISSFDGWHRLLYDFLNGLVDAPAQV